MSVSFHHFTRLHYKLFVMGRFPMWTVYDQTTKEHPGLFVARLVVALPEVRATRFAFVGPTLDGVRKGIPRGLYRMVRDKRDAPEIIETWL